jgi:hypothetical protein
MSTNVRLRFAYRAGENGADPAGSPGERIVVRDLSSSNTSRVIGLAGFREVDVFLYRDSARVRPVSW